MHQDQHPWIDPGDPAQHATTLAAEFTRVYGREPAGVWFAPGRANLNGEHIDFHGGRCLPTALAHGTYVAAAPRDDAVLRLRTLDEQLDDGVAVVPSPLSGADADHPRLAQDAPAWTRYVSGVLWALDQLAPEHPEFEVDAGYGADLLISSTLPIGGGLSSSAALECAAVLAFIATGTPFGAEHPEHRLTGALDDCRRALLAAACMRAEVEVVGAGTGGLDQTVSLRGSRDHLLSLDCRDFTVRALNIAPLLRDHVLLAVDTGQAHWLGDGQFGDRRADAEAAAALLTAQPLRTLLPADPTADDVDAVLTAFDQQLKADAAGSELVRSRGVAACRRRLRHAMTEMLRSEQLLAALERLPADPIEAASSIGEILTQGHLSMREDAEVSFDEADDVVDVALQGDALGARLIGGGFGGSVLALLRAGDVDDITAALLRKQPKLRFVNVVPSEPARAL
ncbi:MAG TPA: galactokinase [Candidatus Nesterenkonia stercoripullorum]|uniref:Galactokinase n=1 Tax=Candidatus Nesterenkonia stercoripullorum TaxID=2838701 RepID=A0A9D1UUM8_9MICC|nr:galactokinase [Candidatus Nesterenkonia stercoripullorum]